MYVRKLMGYKFSIEYKKGSRNRAADALSRREEPQSEEAGAPDPRDGDLAPDE